MKLTDNDFYRLRDLMYNQFGINLAAKRALIEGRLSSVVAQKNFSSFTDYIDNLLADRTGEELSTLVSKLTTNFTYFMREQKHYDFMKNVALPELTSTIKDYDLRIWSAGCSSGEEPYSIAMWLDNCLGFNRLSWNCVVLASDISDNVLEIAKSGIYEEDKLSHLDATWKRKYFKKIENEKYQATEELRKQAAFRKINLMDKDFKFRRDFHIIFCRNVMIYFDKQTKSDVVEKFYNVLEPGGYLFIGLSETLINQNTRFEHVEPAIYRKPK